MKKLDCFAIKNYKCGALTSKRCDNCAFYCTTEEMQRRHVDAAERLSSLDTVTQRYIADKYYFGKICW